MARSRSSVSPTSACEADALAADRGSLTKISSPAPVSRARNAARSSAGSGWASSSAGLRITSNL
jgi:hypothetical protein